MTSESGTLRLSLSMTTAVLPEPDAVLGHFIESYHGTIQSLDEAGHESEIGLVLLRLVNLDLFKCGNANWDAGGKGLLPLFEQGGEEMVSYYEALFSASGRWRRSVGRSRHTENILVIDKLIIDAAHQGKGIGTLIVRRIMQTVAQRASVVTLFPYPLGLAHLEHKQSALFKQAQDRVAAFYNRQGFMPTGTKVMYRPSRSQ